MNGEILSIETAEKIAKLEKENKKLTLENEKLKIKCDFLANKKMLESDKNAKQLEIKAIEQIDYKTRNEKAIEYIKKRDFDEVTMDNGWEIDFDCKENLLKILQGKNDK